MATNPNMIVTCPYNKAHQIIASSLQFHLLKCMSRSGKPTLMLCPFDCTHHILETEFQHHVATCPKRGKFDNMLYDVSGAEDFKLPIADYDPDAQPSSTAESWDDDTYSGYDPSAALENRPGVIRKIHGAPPAQRRAFRHEMRRQFRDNMPSTSDEQEQA